VPKSQISASQALLAAKDIVADIQHFCERQPEACVVGSQATVRLGQRARALALFGRRPPQRVDRPSLRRPKTLYGAFEVIGLRSAMFARHDVNGRTLRG
jgi:Family of unknown function (DUF5330)